MDRVAYGVCIDCPGVEALADGEPPAEPDCTGYVAPRKPRRSKSMLRPTGRPISLAMKIQHRVLRHPNGDPQRRQPGWLTTGEVATRAGMAREVARRHLSRQGITGRAPADGEGFNRQARLFPEVEINAWLARRAAAAAE